MRLCNAHSIHSKRLFLNEKYFIFNHISWKTFMYSFRKTDFFYAYKTSRANSQVHKAIIEK